MTDSTGLLAQALFEKPTLQACSLQQVDYLAHQYPYFSTAQLLLLQKAELNAEAYAQQLQRTALYFSTPLQLHYLLQPALFETALPQAKLFQNPIPKKTVLPEIVDEPQDRIAETTPAEIKVAEPAPQPEKTTVTDTPEKVETEAPAITFEPYHTVDYFASQGIKLSQQEVTNDTLGKQLKSFTEWLKTMKRLPETAAPAPGTNAGERNVEHLAAHSLQSADIVTESMAEVWLKQGNREKAIDVYNKLSLHHPGKSAYFAAKIEALKTSVT